MNLARLRRFLSDDGVERDPGFQAEITRLSLLAIRVGGFVSIGLTWFFYLARFVVAPDPGTLRLRTLEVAAFTALGVVSLWATGAAWAQKRARPAALAMVFLAGAISVGFTLPLQVADQGLEDYLTAQVTVLMLICVTAVPLRPVETCGVGLSYLVYYVVFSGLLHGIAIKPANVLFMVTLTLLSVAITAVVYRQRVDSYRSHQEALSALEDLRRAEARMLLSENAASLGRLSAALSHELNSPIGALLSAIDTLLLLSSRQAVAPVEDQGRLVILQNDIRKTIRDSVERLGKIAARMQRFTNLDRAEVQEANINSLLEDVVALVDPSARERGALEFVGEDVPPLLCRPQQISAVFHNVLSNALQAVDGDGRVTVRTRAGNGKVEIDVHDNGIGLSTDEVERLFDPAFRETGGIVSTGNWGMFSARQIIRQHGGEIAVESGRGRGTTVSVTLPCKGCRKKAAAVAEEPASQPPRFTRR